MYDCLLSSCDDEILSNWIWQNTLTESLISYKAIILTFDTRLTSEKKNNYKIQLASNFPDPRTEKLTPE